MTINDSRVDVRFYGKQSKNDMYTFGFCDNIYDMVTIIGLSGDVNVARDEYEEYRNYNWSAGRIYGMFI